MNVYSITYLSSALAADRRADTVRPTESALDTKTADRIALGTRLARAQNRRLRSAALARVRERFGN